jgi:hypothetical protein
MTEGSIDVPYLRSHPLPTHQPGDKHSRGTCVGRFLGLGETAQQRAAPPRNFLRSDIAADPCFHSLGVAATIQGAEPVLSST